MFEKILFIDKKKQIYRKYQNYSRYKFPNLFKDVNLNFQLCQLSEKNVIFDCNFNFSSNMTFWICLTIFHFFPKITVFQKKIKKLGTKFCIILNSSAKDALLVPFNIFHNSSIGK